MPSVFNCCTCIFIFLSCLISEARSSEDECRHLEFRAAQVFKGKRLINHMIRSVDVMDEQFCGALCFMDPNCVSYNFKTRSESRKHKCELNNATHEGHEKDLEENPDYIYRGAKNKCANDPCNNKATCQTGFTHKKYRCLCTPGFTGQDCSDIDECAAGTHSCDANAECTNTKGSYNCTCKPGYHGDGRNCEDVDECTTGTHNCIYDFLCNNTKGSFTCNDSSCKVLYDKILARENKAYKLKIASGIFLVYCVMNDTGMGPCTGGGWTLVMKINGTKQTFHYDSNLWTDKETFNLAGGETGFDTEETKLPTYWGTPFSKICLGMKISGEEAIHFIAINKTADSLYSLIADGQFRNTSLGRNTWKTLLGSQGSLQLNCNREGFNAASSYLMKSKARIGILGNNENECDTCDSRIGFGTGGYNDDSNTCGNDAKHGGDNGDRSIKTIGYILIQ
ncbi:hypothetical protein ACROYT_G040881 [Oculina patagonica]